MPSVEDIARATLASIDSDASLELARQWVGERFSQIATRQRLRALRKLGTVSLPARISLGTVSAVRDSAVITPDATALATWSTSIVGRSIRIRNTWYEIQSFDGATLTLATPFAEESASAFSYNIVQRYVELPRDVRHIGTFVFERRWTALTHVSASDLERMSPTRVQVGGGPWYYSEAPIGADASIKRVEFYPGNDVSEVIHFTYWADPPALEMRDEIPGDIPAHVLKEGALIDLYRYEAARQARLGNIEAAGFYRNESRAQTSQWESRNIGEAIAADGGADDIRFIAWQTGRSLADGDITTARQHVWAGYR